MEIREHVIVSGEIVRPLIEIAGRDDAAFEAGGDRNLLRTWHDNHRIRWS